MRVRCPLCREVQSVPWSKSGRSIWCQGCGKRIRVPAVARLEEEEDDEEEYSATAEIARFLADKIALVVCALAVLFVFAWMVLMLAK